MKERISSLLKALGRTGSQRFTQRSPLAASPLRRRLSSSGLDEQAKIYLSASNDPYLNLALEDWLFRSAKEKSHVLLFYRNKPCVVIGRNQNPWKELNFPALRQSGIPFVRRRSGGGTVYHDMGNTNYSVAMPRASFDRRSNAELVARAVRKLGPPAEVNDRNDIVVEGFKIRSAYKIVNKRAYHHGTMLIDAQLENLGDLLRNTKTTLDTKGVDSVRSPVRNLRHFTPSLSHESFVRAVSAEFTATYGGIGQINQIDAEKILEEEAVRKGRDELKSWEWSHGQTPEFTHKLIQRFSWGEIVANIHSKHGIILSCEITSNPNNDAEWLENACSTLATDLVGKKYGILDVEEQAGKGPTADARKAIIDWLRRDM